MSENPQSQNNVTPTNPRLVVASFIIGILLLLVLLIGPNLPDGYRICIPNGYAILIAALGAGGFAAGLTGFMNYNEKKVTAAGGFAVFFVVLSIFTYLELEVIQDCKGDPPPSESCQLTPDPVYLDSILNIKDRNLNILNGIRFNENYRRTPIKIASVDYRYGVSMHPTEGGSAVAVFKIPEQSEPKCFRAVFGLALDPEEVADNIKSNPNAYKNKKAKGIVKVDGEILKEYPIQDRFVGKEVNVKIPIGKKRIELIVDPLGTNNTDQTTWAMARFTCDCN
jgi:hypothetical protein